MNTNISEQEVNTLGVVSGCEEVWKDIPGIKGNQASSLGRIRDKNGRIMKQHNAPTSKGYYKNVCVYVDGWSKRFGVHRLVCLAFHPLPEDADSVKYEPNHIDGDKLNNRANNLEWLTRRKNVKHAFDNGLCIVGIRITAKNVKTGEVRKYNSLSEAARSFEKPRQDMRLILAKHKETPFEGEWVFEVDDSSDGKLTRHQAVAVQAKDYRTGEILVFRNATAAGHHTGVQQGTISFNLLRKADNSKENLVNGYVFRLLSNVSVFPSFSEEEVQKSINKYQNRKTAVKLQVTDLQSNTTEIYSSYAEFSRSIGKTPGQTFRMNGVYRNRYHITEAL